MNKKLLHVALGLLAVFLIVLAISTLQASKTGLSTSLNSSKDTPDKLEGKTTVTNETIAAKVDFARKIIAVKDASQAATLKKTVAALGGTIVEETSETTFVVLLSKDKVAEQEATLADDAAVTSIDTDYPATITADKIDWGVERVFAPKVWEKTTGNAVKVAILDTGIDATHSDLAGTVVASYNFVNESTDVTDKHGHGTHVAGVAASIKNDSGYIGASYQAKLLVGKVLDDNGTGYLSDVIEGINWARANGAQVINMSLGSEYNSKILESAIKSAVDAGIIVVAAAGNTGGNMLYPAAYSSVVSVGASDSTDHLASFSAIGATLVAPGVGITSTLPGNTYGRWSGTSMAAPHVSAAAALLIAKGETKVKETLRATASATSAGLLPNLETAVNNQDTQAPLITILEPKHESSISGVVTFNANVTDEFGIKEVVFTIGSTELSRFTTEPYSVTYDTTQLANGTYDFLVTATDQNGNTGSVKVTLTVTNTESSATPSPASSSSLPRQDSDNQSQEVRQDTASDNPSQDVRQDKDVPVGTNYGNRQNEEETPDDSEETKQKDNKKNKENPGKQN